MYPTSGIAAALPRPLPARRAVALAVAFIAIYVLLDWATYIYPIAPFAITPWNPPAGFGLALLLVYGLRFWPALAMAAFLSDVVVRGIPPLPEFEPLAAFVIAAGYVVLAFLLKRTLGFRTEFDRVRDVSILVAAATIGTLLIAMVYVSVYRIGDLVAGQEFRVAMIQFWIGDLIGVVTTTPLLLLLADWKRVRHTLPRRPWPEIAAQLAAVALTLWAIFGLGWADEYKLFYLLFLPLIWVVVNNAIVGATIVISVIQIGLMAAFQLADYKAAAVVEFQFLMLALSVTGLFLGMIVNERRAAREALDESESRLRAIVSTAPDGIVTVDKRGTIVAANPAAARMFGFAAGELQAISVYAVLPDFEQVTRAGHVSEVIGLRRDGSRFAAELSVATTDTDPPELRIAIARDITRRKEIEHELKAKQDELNRSARLAAAGEMAAALAHELHQPLSAIRNYVRALQLVKAPGILPQLLTKVENEAARAAEVVQRLRDFFRGGSSQLQRIAVGPLVQGALEPMRPDAERQRITLATDLACADVALLVDRVQVETILHSLVGNAIEAIGPTEQNLRTICVSAKEGEPGWVQFSVIDSGPGISAAIVDRLFEPFATTKPTGTGLGLPMSRSMVEAHGGRLWAEPAPNGGTMFHVTLPRAEARESSDAE
jgi:two-component system sensor kinase FixL